MTAPYKEGTVFALPLTGKSGYAIGVIARASSSGILICYFFGPKQTKMPPSSGIDDLRPSDAIRILQVSHLALANGDWPVVGELRGWNRSDWPIPVYARHELLSGRSWKVFYSDSDPGKVVEEELICGESSSLPRDSLFGSKAAELEMTRALVE